VLEYLTEEFGNAGSRTHEYGTKAKQAVQHARGLVAAAVGVQPDEVVFTSGATESNNLAILGLAGHGERHAKRHIVSTSIEHKAVLEPLDSLRERGFEITLLHPSRGGVVNPDDVRAALRADTLLVSVMHVNNETGVEQPIPEICGALAGHEAYLHVDAAQGFGKRPEPLRNERIDLISISAHKIYGPKGIGALITRRRGFDRPPLTPLQFGGGQERGLRPGTLAVPLIVGLGVATELAQRDATRRATSCRRFREELLAKLAPLGIVLNGEQERVLPHVLNLSIPELDAEAFMVATKHLIAVSNGSACTSQSYQPSHVLTAMGYDEGRVRSAIRISWCHMTPPVDWVAVVSAIQHVR
jgi:cysteine desulfurase